MKRKEQKGKAREKDSTKKEQAKEKDHSMEAVILVEDHISAETVQRGQQATGRSNVYQVFERQE